MSSTAAVATATACCGGKKCCSVWCASCASCGIAPKNWPKVAYLIQSVVLMGVSLILLFSLRSAAEEWSWFQCLDTDEESSVQASGSSCYGIKAVLAMSFTLFLFHLTILIAISPRIGCSSYVHDSFWIIKFVLILVVFTACFFIPHSFYKVWANICRAGSVLFLLIQAYFLLNASYALNDRLILMTVNGSDREQTASKVLILVLSIVLSSGISVWLGY